MDRDIVLGIVEEHAKSDSLRKHLLAVETCMKAFARQAGEDEDKRLAASVSREDIVQGAEELGVELDQHIQFVIDAPKPIAPRLGLEP